jgi:hypothetical protein
MAQRLGMAQRLNERQGNDDGPAGTAMGQCRSFPTPSRIPTASTAFGVAVLCLALLGAVGCKGAGASTPDAGDDAGDGSAGERPIVLCPEVDAGAPTPEDDAGTTDGGVASTDEFGPNAPAGKTASSLGRVNVYEVATAALLERVDVYLRADLDSTRVTIAVQEAVSRTAAFRKLADVQMDVGTCQGWATSGTLAIPLVAGRYYAIGFDPNQVVTPFVNTDGDVVPIDGAFGRLIGSRTATSVSVTNLTWDKFTEKEYNRQRLQTSPRAPDPVPDGGADTTDAGGDSRG